MNCCKCKCSFAKCVEEHKKDLKKEFNEMITNWMKEHPEVKSVWIGNGNCYLSNSLTIYQDMDYKINVHFE